MIRKALDVTGIVQGVGFRPCVFRMAEQRGLTGTIANTDFGVAIEIQGDADAVHDFVDRLAAEAPPLAHVLGTHAREIECIEDEDGLSIVPSRGDPRRRALVLADVGICPDCLRELRDPADRRCGYPFINCTYCGPRYTIVSDIPYDRPLTAMDPFPMCGACRAEYEDPADRRFHAQATACNECGPQVVLHDKDGRPVAEDDPIAATAARLRDGAVVAIKGLGGFHLAVDATNADAVARLRVRKRRVEKPFAVMVPDLQRAQEFCEIDSDELLSGPEQPIVLLRRKPDARIVADVAPRNSYLGLFLPYTPLHHLLFDAGGFDALVMTSANLSEEPIACENEEAMTRLQGIADWYLVHDREIRTRCDDSVVRVSGGRVRQMRRSRGYVPVPLLLRREVPSVLAVGGELKNTVCFTRERYAFLSQHVGDLENAETFSFFREVVGHLRHLLGVEPEAIAYDLHPDYLATQWALQQEGTPQIGVQHHHAHIASCMAENHLQGEVIGIALDGTGYGTDGRIWGGEVFVGGYDMFTRVAHLGYVPMPGGAAAIREPWRMAIGYLHSLYGGLFLDLDLPFLPDVRREQAKLLTRMIEQDVNTPLTSSCGRLFDAVAAMLGLREEINYEAQAAIELEMAIDGTPEDDEAYPLTLKQDGTISARPLFDALIRDIHDEVAPGVASRRFHNGVVEVFADAARKARYTHRLERVCLSGGCFNNAVLFERLEARLREDGFEVYTHADVPAGDGGLALGQAMIAIARLQR